MKQRNVSSVSRLGAAVIICLLGTMGLPANATRVEVAGDLLVDLRSEDLAPGAVTEWPNHGSLGGVFTAVGTPTIEAIGGWDNVVRLDGTGAYVGPVSPAGITGSDTRSIEVWAYNIAESKEECMVSWSHRGGPDGTNLTFNYGWKDFGAAGHWGAADIGWKGYTNAVGGSGGYPPLETWQYLVYTYDGTMCRLYVNGEFNNEKAVVLNTHAGNAIRVGAQGNNDGTPSTGEKNFTGAIAQVRVHDGVLTPEQIKTNAQIRIQSFGQASDPNPRNGVTDAPLRGLTLSWEPGEYPATHTVYFGKDANAVANATALAVSNTDVNSYDPGRLEFGQTYFWRVDEVSTGADKTVYAGPVWSFTVESFSSQVPSAGITATASSSFNADTMPQKTVDGSGLDASDQHDVTGTNMWLSGAGQQPPVWIQYQFDSVRKLDRMWVWNSNQTLESIVGFGVKTATVEYSVDGVNWTALTNVPEFQQAPSAAGYAHDTEVSFGGVAAKFVKMTCTASWGERAQYGLSEVRFFDIPVTARNPAPATGATGVALDTILSWRAGREAVEHKVYFGTDSQAVSNGTAPATTVTQAGYSPSLSLGVTCYWRIDEVNAAEAISTWAGPVWSFATVDHVAVEDMEGYNDTTKPIYETWIDGYGTNTNGGQVGNDIAPFMNTATFHDGRQSMPFRYNIGGSYTLAEATRTFAAQDWTASGVKTLRLFFYGNTGNTAAGLYVKINGTKISYAGEATNVLKAEWTQWDIPLSSVPVSTLTSVTDLTLGAATGTGNLLFDDIALY